MQRDRWNTSRLLKATSLPEDYGEAFQFGKGLNVALISFLLFNTLTYMFLPIQVYLLQAAHLKEKIDRMSNGELVIFTFLY